MGEGAIYIFFFFKRTKTTNSILRGHKENPNSAYGNKTKNNVSQMSTFSKSKKKRVFEIKLHV